MSDQSIVPVTQADRVMAVHIGKSFAQWTERQIEITLAGEGDEYPMVQSVARHRIAEREACAVEVEKHYVENAHFFAAAIRARS